MDTDAIVDFVRNTLGCGCPPEVFERIDHETAESTGTLFAAFDAARAGVAATLTSVTLVGERLLVARTTTCEEAAITRLLEAGTQLRDERGYNRFRLAVDGATLSEDQTRRLVMPFDEKVHLHALP